MKVDLRMVFLIISGFVFSVTLLAAPPATATSNQALKSVRTKIDSLKKDIAHKQTVQKEATTAIQQSEYAIAQAAQALKNLELKHAHSEEQLAKLRHQVQVSKNQLATTSQRVNQILARQYKSGQQDTMTLMMNADNPNQNSRDLTYYRHIVHAQQQLFEQLKRQQQQFEILSMQLEAELDRLNRLSNRKSDEKSNLIRGKTIQQHQLNQLSSELAARKSKLAQLQEDEKRLSNLIAQINQNLQKRRVETNHKGRQDIARKEPERKSKLAKATEQQGEPGLQSAKQAVVEQTVAETADRRYSGQAFASLQGKMKLPTIGQIMGRFGQLRQAGSLWKGIFIKTALNQPVHSVADGTIVYADQLRGFGNTVIVNHGDNYMTVYTWLSSIQQHTGNAVRAGDILGTTGLLDNDESGLYFEIRYMGRPLNPQTWTQH